MRILPDLHIAERARDIWSRYVQRPVPSPTVATERRTATIGAAVPSVFQDEFDRRWTQPVTQYHRYCLSDLAIFHNPFLRSALRIYCYGAAGAFLGVNCTEAPDPTVVNKIFVRLIKRIRLRQQIQEIVRRSILYGNGFLQHDIELDGEQDQYRVMRLLWMPVYGMVRNSDELDRFVDRSRAFEQRDIHFGLTNQTIPIGIFPDWKINHLKMYALDGERYGSSLIESAIFSGASERAYLSAIELFWSRKFSRPADAWRIEGPVESGERLQPNKDQIDRLIELTSKARRVEQGKEPPRDLYAPNTTVTRLSGDPNTDKTQDVEFMHGQALAELQQSPGMISDDKFANVGVLVERFRQLYISEEWLTEQIREWLKPTFDFELALHGIAPSLVEYRFEFGQMQLEQDMLARNQEARADLIAGRITDEEALRVASSFYRFDYGQAERARKLAKQTQQPVQVAKQPTVPTGAQNPKNFERDELRGADPFANELRSNPYGLPQVAQELMSSWRN